MNSYLSNEMPELTDQELSWKGSDTVSFYDEKVGCIVSAQYSSIQSFVDHNNFPAERMEELMDAYNYNYKFEMETEHGVVGIYRLGHEYFAKD